MDDNNDTNRNGIPEQSDLDISPHDLQPFDGFPEVQLLAIPVGLCNLSHDCGTYQEKVYQV